MRPGVLVLFVLGMRYCLAEEEDSGVIVFGANEDSCTHYCAGTYPEHTYPNVSPAIDSELHDCHIV